MNSCTFCYVQCPETAIMLCTAGFSNVYGKQDFYYYYKTALPNQQDLIRIRWYCPDYIYNV